MQLFGDASYLIEALKGTHSFDASFDFTHFYAATHARTCTQAHIQKHTHTQLHTHTHTYTHTRTALENTRTYAYKPRQIRTHMRN